MANKDLECMILQKPPLAA